MKKIYVLILIALIFGAGCKKDTTSIEDEQIVDSISTESETTETLNFDHLKEKVKDSQKMTIDIFFAISALHKNHINKYESQLETMTEEQLKVFYAEKKHEFFQTIKYTEEEYDSFSIIMIEKYPAELNNYMSEHPEYREYLSMP